MRLTHAMTALAVAAMATGGPVTIRLTRHSDDLDSLLDGEISAEHQDLEEARQRADERRRQREIERQAHADRAIAAAVAKRERRARRMRALAGRGFSGKAEADTP